MDRELLFFARSRDQPGWIQFDYAFTHQKLKERAQRGELSGDRRLLLFVRMKSREPLANCQMIDLPDVREFTFSIPWVCVRQIVEELQEVALVIAQGERTDVTLLAQVFEDLSEQ